MHYYEAGIARHVPSLVRSSVYSIDVVQHGCMQVSVGPAQASADTSTWRLLNHDSSDRSSHEHTLQAGQKLCVEVDLRDAFGNLAGEYACAGTAMYI